MPDIALRFHKDMLVLSTPVDYQLVAQGFTEPEDRAYVSLCEPEVIEETYKLEQVMETSCFVTATEDITRARLAHARFEHQAEDMARIAYQTGASFSPQHLLAAIGPTGLPLDPTSKSSLKQSVEQYRDATKVLIAYPFDAVYFNGFSNLYDAQCALMGARALFDGPVMITLKPDSAGMFPDGRTIAEAAALCDEYGASVIGISSPCDVATVAAFFTMLRSATTKPLLCEFWVTQRNNRQFEPTSENPYPTPNAVFDAACALRQLGIQFFRASGVATPAYTGALIAAVMGSDVVQDR